MDDSMRGVGTPEGVVLWLYPAGPVPRLLALGLDFLVGLVVLFAVALVFVALKITGAWALYLSSFAVLSFGMVACEVWWDGATPGKRALGLQVMMADGRPVTLQGSLLRNLLRFPDQFLGLGWFVALLTPGFRRIGDLVGGTLVVYRDEVELRRSWSQPAPEGLVPQAPRRPMGPDAAWAALEFGRRWDELGPGLRRELAREAGDVYSVHPDDQQPEQSLRAVAAWYRGRR
jgi:uncharacterized RDD family membrane protein YckC